MAVNQTNQQPKMSQSNPPVIEQPSFPIEMPSRIIIMWGTVPPTNLRFLTAGVLHLGGCASMPCRLLLNHVKMQPKPSLTYLILNHVKMQPKPSLSYLRFLTAGVLDLRGCDVYRWACRSIAIDVRLCHRGMMLGSYGLGSILPVISTWTRSILEMMESLHISQHDLPLTYLTSIFHQRMAIPTYLKIFHNPNSHPRRSTNERKSKC